jgi:hypothetical protein
MFSRHETKHGPILELLWLITIMVGFFKELKYTNLVMFSNKIAKLVPFIVGKKSQLCVNSFGHQINIDYHLLDVWGQYNMKLIV